MVNKTLNRINAKYNEFTQKQQQQKTNKNIKYTRSAYQLSGSREINFLQLTVKRSDEKLQEQHKPHANKHRNK